MDKPSDLERADRAPENEGMEVAFGRCRIDIFSLDSWLVCLLALTALLRYTFIPLVWVAFVKYISLIVRKCKSPIIPKPRVNHHY